MRLSSYDVAEWLHTKCNDEEFVETFVLLDIMRHGDIKKGLSKNDILNANIERITNDIKFSLEEIIPVDSEIDESAWWKKKND